MSDKMQTAMVAVGLLLIGALVGLVLVIAIDPACGPDGDSQRACAADLIADLTGGR